jgi:hypothetical protein
MCRSPSTPQTSVSTSCEPNPDEHCRLAIPCRPDRSRTPARARGNLGTSGADRATIARAPRRRPARAGIRFGVDGSRIIEERRVDRAAAIAGGAPAMRRARVLTNTGRAVRHPRVQPVPTRAAKSDAASPPVPWCRAAPVRAGGQPGGDTADTAQRGDGRAVHDDDAHS